MRPKRLVETLRNLCILAQKSFRNIFLKKKLCNGNFSHQQVIFKTGSLSVGRNWIRFSFSPFKMENECEIETYLITLVIICWIGSMFNTRSVMWALNLKNIFKLDDLILYDLENPFELDILTSWYMFLSFDLFGSIIYLSTLVRLKLIVYRNRKINVSINH